MADLAALLHAEWDRRLCEPSEPGVPCSDCIESAARLEAAGVRVDDLCECGLPDKGHPVRCQPFAAPPSEDAAPLDVERLASALRVLVPTLPSNLNGRMPVAEAIAREYAAIATPRPRGGRTMTKDWIDRYTCDRCGECIEQLHSDETWPHGWQEVRVTNDHSRLMCPACMGFVRAAIAPAPKEADHEAL